MIHQYLAIVKNGPIEFLDNGNGGILFKSNDEKSLLRV